jgi:hypothetical protein
MRVITFVFSLMTAVSASKTLHYTVPKIFKVAASNCTLPSDFVVTDFTTDYSATVTFGFIDADTHIKTLCQRNSTSTPSGPSKNLYRCDNADVAFIYQTTGIAGLTLTERACPGGR